MADAAHMLSDVAGLGVSLFAAWAVTRRSHVSFRCGQGTHCVPVIAAPSHRPPRNHAIPRLPPRLWLPSCPPPPAHTPSFLLSFGYHRAEIIGALLSILVIWAVTGERGGAIGDRREQARGGGGGSRGRAAVNGLLWCVHLEVCLGPQKPRTPEEPTLAGLEFSAWGGGRHRGGGGGTGGRPW